MGKTGGVVGQTVGGLGFKAGGENWGGKIVSLRGLVSLHKYAKKLARADSMRTS